MYWLSFAMRNCIGVKSFKRGMLRYFSSLVATYLSHKMSFNKLLHCKNKTCLWPSTLNILYVSVIAINVDHTVHPVLKLDRNIRVSSSDRFISNISHCPLNKHVKNTKLNTLFNANICLLFICIYYFLHFTYTCYDRGFESE